MNDHSCKKQHAAAPPQPAIFSRLFAVGLGALSAFFFASSKRVGAFSGVLPALRAKTPRDPRREALQHWGKTFGCTRGLHDGVDMTSPAATAASAATLHAVRALETRGAGRLYAGAGEKR